MLRERQRVFVDRMRAMAVEHGSALGVAPTGAGKTVCLAALAQVERQEGRVLWLQHRVELLNQNERSWRTLDPEGRSGFICPGRADLGGDVVFGMVQSVARRLARMDDHPWSAILIDEAHHTPARSYRTIIERVRARSPNARVYGVTATPGRGDGAGYKGLFHGVADVVLLDELIESGVLVPPKAFALAREKAAEIRALPRVGGDYDAHAAAELLDHPEFMGMMVREWIKRCRGRPTVAFCPTVEYAIRLAVMFREYGIRAEHIDGSMEPEERASILERFRNDMLSVLTNCIVLTEGWDCPPVSCVLLARPCAHYGTMVQMIGRGLRTSPDTGKEDCIVLDFGASLLTHGTISRPVVLDGKSQRTTLVACECCAHVYDRADHRQCPSCGCSPPRTSILGRQLRETPSGDLDKELPDLHEIDILTGTGLRWVEVPGVPCWMLRGEKIWIAAARQSEDQWVLVVGGAGVPIQVAARPRSIGEIPALALAAMAERGDKGPKTKWYSQAASIAQRELMKGFGVKPKKGITKYEAACMLAFLLNAKRMEKLG